MRRGLAVGGAVALVVVAGAAGFATGTFAGGGGSQPEDVLPASTIAFADVDLDPSPDQKLNVVRLLGRLPQVRDTFGSEPDLRELIVQAATSGTPLEDADLDEWFADRLGVGLVWDEPTESLTPVVAMQASDTDAAVDDLRSRLGDAQVAVMSDYVVVTAPSPGAGGDLHLAPGSGLLGMKGLGVPPLDLGSVKTQTAAEVVSAAETAPLSGSSVFDQTFDHLDGGIASFYLDGAGITAMAQRLGPHDGAAAGSAYSFAGSGAAAAVLRAEPDALELVGWSSAAPKQADAASLAAGLPADTALALEVTGGSALVADRWQTLTDAADSKGRGGRGLERTLAEIEARLGIRLPDDLETLAGDDAVLAVDGDSLLTGIPGAGIVSVTDPEAGADLARRLEHSLATLTGGFGLVAQGTRDGMVVATSAAYAKTLASGDGDLGTSPRFQRALPDAPDATHLLWVDLAAVTDPVALTVPDAADALAPLDSLGVTVGPRDDGTGVRLRLVFTEDAS